MATVFIVYGYDDYEYPFEPLRAFESSASAAALLAALNAHKEQRPPYPENDDDDAVLDAHSAAVDEWEKASPTNGDGLFRAGYGIHEMQVSP